MTLPLSLSPSLPLSLSPSLPLSLPPSLSLTLPPSLPLSLPFYLALVLSLVFRPDGDQLAVASLDAQISFWDIRRFEQLMCVDIFVLKTPLSVSPSLPPSLSLSLPPSPSLSLPLPPSPSLSLPLSLPLSISLSLSLPQSISPSTPLSSTQVGSIEGRHDLEIGRRSADKVTARTLSAAA